MKIHKAFLFLLVLMSLDVSALTCEGDCTESEISQQNGCSIYPTGTCNIRTGNECTSVKNHTAWSHFIPGKVGKKDWTAFKEKSNKQHFSIGACGTTNTNQVCGEGQIAKLTCSVYYQNRNWDSVSPIAQNGTWAVFKSGREKNCDNGGCGLRMGLECEGSVSAWLSYQYQEANVL